MSNKNSLSAKEVCIKYRKSIIFLGTVFVIALLLPLIEQILLKNDKIERANRAQCRSNIRAILQAISEYKEHFNITSAQTVEDLTRFDMLPRSRLSCPSLGKEGSPSYVVSADNYDIICEDISNHPYINRNLPAVKNRGVLGVANKITIVEIAVECEGFCYK